MNHPENEQPMYQALIKKLKDTPLLFGLKDAKELTAAQVKGELKHNIIRQTAIEVLDLSPTGIFRSGATNGIVGWINARSRAKRQDRFWACIQQDFRKDPNNIVAVAEGDSWFEHPFLTDIIDHLNRRTDTAVFSLAYAADWLDNMLYQGEYVDMISVIKPDVFLVSGGGNDLLGEKKIAIMCRGIDEGQQEKNVQNCPGYVYVNTINDAWFIDGLQRLKDNGQGNDADDIQKGIKYLTKEFFGFMNIMQWQYNYLFHSLRQKYELMPILTQSYDYAMPQALIRRPVRIAYWYQRLINQLQGSGKWIETAFRTAKIYKPEVMHQVIKAMLFCFQQKIIETANTYSYIYHIDSQGLAHPDEWFDEIHLKSHRYLQISETYAKAMRDVVHQKQALMDNKAPAQKSSSNSQVKRVYRSRDTVNTTTFRESFAAFYRMYRSTGQDTAIKLLIVAAGICLLLVLSPSPYPHIQTLLHPPKVENVSITMQLCYRLSGWVRLPFSYKLLFFIAILFFMRFIYRLGKALVLSWVFSRPFR
nr:hypothetical protein [uncultured Arsenicibacter sp.]